MTENKHYKITIDQRFIKSRLEKKIYCSEEDLKGEIKNIIGYYMHKYLSVNLEEVE